MLYNDLNYNLIVFRGGPKFDGKEVSGNRGYKYFGAAKDLPGVRELFEQESIQAPKKSRAELVRNVDADYYGYRDEDDGVVLKEESQIQRQELLNLALAEGILDKEAINKAIDELFVDNKQSDEEDINFTCPKKFISYVPYIPTQEDIKERILNTKKRELLQQFVSMDQD